MGNAHVDSKGIVVSCASCGQQNRLPFARLAAETRCGKCKTPLGAPSEPVEVPDAAAFDALIGGSSLPVVVDFWAPWCGPCRMVAPEIARVARTHAGRYVVAKVNTDEVAEIGDRYRIQSIPTMAVFADGKERARTTGARPAAEIESFVESAVQGR
jgi:thioredoxin 2